jgi:hypothetical protein
MSEDLRTEDQKELVRQILRVFPRAVFCDVTGGKLVAARISVEIFAEAGKSCKELSEAEWRNWAISAFQRETYLMAREIATVGKAPASENRTVAVHLSDRLPEKVQKEEKPKDVPDAKDVPLPMRYFTSEYKSNVESPKRGYEFL